MADNIQITGMEELNKVLKKLPDRITRNILSAGVRAGAQVIRKAAIVKCGGGKKDIAIRKARSPKGTVAYKIGPSKEKWYLKFREFGTYGGFTGQYKFAPRWKGGGHTPNGQAARPFLRPALDENATKAIQAMGKKMGQRIEKEALKLRG